MRPYAFLLAAVYFTAISGHTLFSTLHIGDKNQGDAVCIRMPMDGATSTSPIIELKSNTMACNVDGDTGVARVCPAKQGDKLTFTWRWTANEPELGSIDISHKGPCSVYMKKVDSAIRDPGHGDGWFKVYDFGHDENNKWCTEHLIEAGGLLSINLPWDLAGGYYLVRPELLSLHQSYESPENPSQPQFYTGCAQIFLDSSATGKPDNMVSIPGYVKSSDASMKFNIYADDSYPYLMHGPPVSKISSSKTSRVRIKSRQSNGKQTEGLKPENCVDENGNWCGIELETYNDMQGCFDQGENCWKQLDPCYNSAPPTGFKGCSAWEKKCQEMTDSCNSGNFIGPPNAGKIITPPPSGGKVYDLSKAIGMKDVAIVSDGASSKAASSSFAAPSNVASLTSALASIVSSSAIASSLSAAPSDNQPATTAKPSYPGSVNVSPPADKKEGGKKKGGKKNDVKLVYVTVTLIANADGTFNTAFPADTEAAKFYSPHAKRQTFKIKPDIVSAPEDPSLFGESLPQEDVAPAEASPAPVTYLPAPVISMASDTIVPGPFSPVISEAPVESLPPVDLPVTRFEFKNAGSNANSISVETRPIIPTTDGSCGQVAGMRCEYDSIFGTIAGCCSRFGYCGYSADHCGSGCQVGYGRCDGFDLKMGKRCGTNDGLQTVRRMDPATVSEPESMASLSDIAQRLRAKELYEEREGKQPSVPIVPDFASRLNEYSARKKILSHEHRHRRRRHH